MDGGFGRPDGRLRPDPVAYCALRRLGMIEAV